MVICFGTTIIEVVVFGSMLDVDVYPVYGKWLGATGTLGSEVSGF